MEIEASSRSATRSTLIPTWPIVLGIVLAVVLAALLVWAIIWLAGTYPAEIEAVRDVFIIAMAMGSCLFGLVLTLLLIMAIRLVNMLEFEIKPILEQTNETVKTLRGTTAFVSKNVVRPVATAGGYLAGARRGLRVLFGDPKRNLPD